ncbi:MAG: FGGY family carbohydrate kinase [Alphaproteobacteria bacterium]
MTKSLNILVLDLGSTHLKASILSPDLEILFENHKKNIRISTPYYEALDVADIGDFIFKAIQDTVDTYSVGDIIISTHGSSLVLVDVQKEFSPFYDSLALPAMYYGCSIDKNIYQDYIKEAPDFLETFAEVSPLALTGAFQIFWQSKAWPQEFSKTDCIMMWPSYWSFRLSGTICNDYSALGAQNQIWNPITNDFSSIIKKYGWDKLFASARPSAEPIGLLHPEICKKYNLKNQPNILCGVHDSNANYWRFVQLGFKDETILSTGTWIISFNPNLDPKKLEGKSDCCTNTSVQGKPISCSRYQGGMELSILLKQMGNIDVDTKIDAHDLKQALKSNCYIVPSFASSGGPIANTGTQGKIEGELPKQNNQKYALAILYSAMMTQISLDYIDVGSQIIIDGPFTKNPLFLQLIAIFNKNADIYISNESSGTLFGAAMLSKRANKPKDSHLEKIECSQEYIDLANEIKAYQKDWLGKIEF